MGYFVIIVFSTFLGSPPELLPIAFKNDKDCENYLTKEVKKKFANFYIEETKELKYLTNITNNKFAICKKLEYPIIKAELIK